jgi:hypothetical protein
MSDNRTTDQLEDFGRKQSRLSQSTILAFVWATEETTKTSVRAARILTDLNRAPAKYESGDRLERILTMVYVVQNYWAYFGLYPSSGM